MPETKRFSDVDRGVSFHLRDPLDHPFYWWPRTRVGYHVTFDVDGVGPDDLELVRRDTGAAVPFQLSDIVTDDEGLESAVVNFFTDLPSGGQRQFDLRCGDAGGTATPDAPVDVSREDGTIVLDGGAIRVRLPASQEDPDPENVPGPIVGLDRGTGWIGDSELLAPGIGVEEVTTERVESGPLFVTCRVTYRFGNGGSYTATVRCLSGTEFVQFTEEIEGLDPGDEVYLETDWSDLDPTHRGAPNHPVGNRPYAEQYSDEPGVGRYDWDPIDEPYIDVHHSSGAVDAIDDRGELCFRLGPYNSPGGYTGGLAFANFWNEGTGDTLGAFVNRVNWEDGEYSTWGAADTLQVRYVYRDGRFFWRWPLVSGTRSTCLACYDHEKDIEAMERLEALHERARDGEFEDGREYHVSLAPVSHTLFLHNRYSTIDLDRVKDWELTYPGDGATPTDVFDAGSIDSGSELQRELYEHPLVTDLPTIGTRQNTSTNPVVSRVWHREWVDAYSRLAPELDPEEYERVTAMYLFMAHLYASDQGLLPIKPMLGDRPNFVSDVKCMVGMMAVLFPEHPRATEWANQFEATVELLTRYHVRPPVEPWDAKGGRWTENLTTYTFASFVPLLRAAFLLEEHYDGRGALAVQAIEWLGDWLVNALSAPFDGENAGETERLLDRLEGAENHVWGIVEPGDGPRRIYPPQGAHATRGTPPREVWLLGQLLRRYSPAVAEALMWAARPTDDGHEFRHEPDPNPWDAIYRQYLDREGGDNRGTDPGLETRKYTGYGVVLRSAVDTPEEVSVHLQQIDDGPNYRWGIAGQGGCGTIYYAAAGDIYSHHGKEDVGDRFAHDTDFCCTFGVWTDGTFRSIGRNVLDGPVYDLDTAAYAELRPDRGEDAYAWPAYQGRTALLVDNDYLVTYDAVFSEDTFHRFSWFTHVEDDLPAIHMVRGGGAEGSRRGTAPTELSTPATEGIWRDGHGDCMAVITHRELDVTPTEYGCTVAGDGYEDRVFRAQERIDHAEEGVRFDGTAGVVRQHDDGTTDLTLVAGSLIGTENLTVRVPADAAIGLDATFDPDTSAVVTGTCDGPEGATVTLSFDRDLPDAAAVFVDGERRDGDRDGDTLSVTLPSGEHRWEVTTRRPRPRAPAIERVETGADGARVVFETVPGATRYRVETSPDSGTTWAPAGETTDGEFTLDGVDAGDKRHVRVVAENDDHESDAGAPHPVYVTDDPPDPPAGVRLSREDGGVVLRWGRVHGASSYTVYRRRRGEEGWVSVFEGTAREYHDDVPVPARMEPGEDAHRLPPETVPIHEYAVSASNGNGEGDLSRIVDTDPTSWLNWDPKPGEGFRRRRHYRTAGSGDPPPYYPD